MSNLSQKSRLDLNGAHSHFLFNLFNKFLSLAKLRFASQNEMMSYLDDELVQKGVS